MTATGLDRPWTPEIAVSIQPGAIGTPEDRIAFVLHAAELLNHYEPVWAHLDPATFEIVVAGELSADADRITAFAVAHGYGAAWIGDVLQAGRTYAVVVSNHIGAGGDLGGGRGQALRRLGRRHVRMMYALGKDAWNYAPWNDQYDLILCWGPYHAERLASFKRPRVVQVGPQRP